MTREKRREAGELDEPREGNTATLLQDRSELVNGGSGPAGQLASAEMWELTTETSVRQISWRRHGVAARLRGWKMDEY